MKRPAWWNRLHDEALACLVADWRPLAVLRATARVVTLDDLVVAGFAEVKREPVTRNGIAAGEHTFYRLATT